MNDRCDTDGNMETGDVDVNFAIAISAPDLYKQCSI